MVIHAPRWLIAWTVLLLSQVADPTAEGSTDLIARMVTMELWANESAGLIAAVSTPAQQTVADVAPTEFCLQQD